MCQLLHMQNNNIVKEKMEAKLKLEDCNKAESRLEATAS